jgi:hypothetical protein
MLKMQDENDELLLAESNIQKVNISDVRKDKLAKYKSQLMLIQEYILQCEKELSIFNLASSMLDTLDCNKLMTLPSALYDIHAHKSTQIVSLIEDAIEHSRELAYVYTCEIDELNK